MPSRLPFTFHLCPLLMSRIGILCLSADHFSFASDFSARSPILTALFEKDFKGQQLSFQIGESDGQKQKLS